MLDPLGDQRAIEILGGNNPLCGQDSVQSIALGRDFKVKISIMIYLVHDSAKKGNSTGRFFVVLHDENPSPLIKPR
jgi:hypothetical protein